MVYKARLVVAESKAEVAACLNPLIVKICEESMKERGVFTIALSGGSLPSFLVVMEDSFEAAEVDPCFDKWHVILADERCVTLDHPDSNMGSLQAKLFSKLKSPIPPTQIYPIQEQKLNDSTAAVAQDYEQTVRQVLQKSSGNLDLAVLGLGPDGHTCSLFPNHALLEENEKWVAPIQDSPKPPSCRITLTYPLLNTRTRHAIFCGAGASKAPVIQAIFDSVKPAETSTNYDVTIKEPYPYPCAGVLPAPAGENEHSSSLTYVVDKDATEGLEITK